MQDPTVANCPAVETFLWLARHDPTTEVRRAALAAMVLTTKTLPSLIERCRDLSDTVRRTAYKILTARSVLRPLSIAKRIRILQDGLTDRSAEVRQAAQELVLAWFNATNRDPIHLLRRLDTEGVPETSQLMLDNLFAALPETEFDQMVTEWTAKCLTEQKTLHVESHTAEAAFFWRALVEFLHKRANKAKSGPPCSPLRLASTESPGPDDNAQTEQASTTISVESILPSVSAYVDMTKRLVDHLVEMVLAGDFDEKTMEQECVVEHVLRLAHSIDLSDEFGRRRLVTLIHDWITSPTVPNTLSPHLLKVHALLEPSLRKRINNVIEMISELCDPVEPPLLSASIPLSVQAPDGITNNQPSADGINGVIVTNPPVIGKEEERAIRLKIAKLEVRMNELNESLHNCVRRKEFEQATGLRDECAQLEAERSALLRQLHGSPLTTAVVQPVDGDTNNVVDDTKSDPDPTAPVIVHSDDEPKVDDEEDREEPHGLLDRCSAAVLLKANRLAALVVQQSPTLWRLPASLRSLLDSLIFPSIQHEDPSVRNQAILTLGLCCSMDLPLAIQYMSLFYSAMRVDHVMISETALRCIIDCLLIFGFRPFHEAKVRPNARVSPTNEAAAIAVNEGDADDNDEDDDEVSDASDFIVLMRRNDQDITQTSMASVLMRRKEMSKTAARFLKPIIALLDSEDDDLRTTSALGLAKLLLYDRFISSHVLSQLILLWFNPISEDRPQIRRGLACFFTDYVCGNTAYNTGTGASPNGGNSEHQAALADAVLPTLTALIRAPASSPLSEVEAADVAALLAHLTDRTLLSLRAKQEKTDAIVPVNVERADEPQGTDDDDDDDGHQEADEDNVKAADAPECIPVQENPHHDSLALQLANEVLKAPQSAEAKLYLRMLCQLHVSRSNVAVHRELLLLSEAMFKYADRSSTLLLHRFRKQVNQSLVALGLNPDQMLAEAKEKKSVTAINDDAASLNSSEPQDLDTTLIASGDRPRFDPNHPTLLGSARVNMHLLNEDAVAGQDAAAVSQLHGGASMVHPAQTNRTLQGLSLLDKSGRHTNLLNFSESDDSEEQEESVDLVSSKRLSVTTKPVEPRQPSKRNTRVRVRVQVPPDSSDEETEGQPQVDDNKENSVIQTSRRSRRLSEDSSRKIPEQTQSHKPSAISLVKTSISGSSSTERTVSRIARPKRVSVSSSDSPSTSENRVRNPRNTPSASSTMNTRRNDSNRRN
ncbi:hypothetical protein PHET_06625 [Paragonimus heterotremus]|uniref:UVR domain-containing protein n=1 Tax=Paragonimus heterotremus TaxID=100268 RepID=A0A8J4WGY5_9TREM|nr:hypothetical protein PHET_06625 [Paragonimus heterotremus]